MESPQFSIKILGVDFGNSMFDNSNWNRVRLSLRGKKIIVNQILSVKYILFQNISKMKLKKEYEISPRTEKNTISQAHNSTLHLEG